MSKNIVLVWLVLFALAPCSVKTIFSESTSNYQVPLNKTRTTQPVNTCHFLIHGSEQKITSQRKKRDHSFTAFTGFNDTTTPNRIIKIPKEYANTLSGNNPPKYILYKRLKVDIA